MEKSAGVDSISLVDCADAIKKNIVQPQLALGVVGLEGTCGHHVAGGRMNIMKADRHWV